MTDIARYPCKICAEYDVAQAFALLRGQGYGYKKIWKLLAAYGIGKHQCQRHARHYASPVAQIDATTAPKVLIYDIETAPNMGYSWGKYDQNILDFAREWYILSIAYKWAGDESARVIALPDFPLYATEPENDYELVAHLWFALDEADVTITHNGKNFDRGKAYARMIFHQLPPPSPCKEIDTLQIARREFNFTSNKLGDLCKYLGLDHKQDSGGLKTWLGCMSGDPVAWETLKEYNLQDVFITEQLYLRFQPWISRHPNFSMIADRPAACPRCGSENGMQARGWQIYTVTRRRRFQCTACGGYSVGRTMVKSDVQFISL